MKKPIKLITDTYLYKKTIINMLLNCKYIESILHTCMNLSSKQFSMIV